MGKTAHLQNISVMLKRHGKFTKIRENWKDECIFCKLNNTCNGQTLKNCTHYEEG